MCLQHWNASAPNRLLTRKGKWEHKIYQQRPWKEECRWAPRWSRTSLGDFGGILRGVAHLGCSLALMSKRSSSVRFGLVPAHRVALLNLPKGLTQSCQTQLNPGAKGCNWTGQEGIIIRCNFDLDFTAKHWQYGQKFICLQYFVLGEQKSLHFSSFIFNVRHKVF